jgi:hypothetical protein
MGEDGAQAIGNCQDCEGLNMFWQRGCFKAGQKCPGTGQELEKLMEKWGNS